MGKDLRQVDNQIEIKHLKNAQLSVIRSDYGHYAGAGKSKKAISVPLINK